MRQGERLRFCLVVLFPSHCFGQPQLCVLTIDVLFAVRLMLFLAVGISAVGICGCNNKYVCSLLDLSQFAHWYFCAHSYNEKLRSCSLHRVTIEALCM